MEETYAREDRPASELENLLAELSRAHELFSNLEHRLAPVIHHGLKDGAQLAGSVPSKPESHISQAVSVANALGNRINELTKSLAV